uniref:Leucine rich repeat containing 59 n=1 Tax=Poecilia mexicana TaxID=48701 RepID=A0A3B3WM49_9TELE
MCVCSPSSSRRKTLNTHQEPQLNYWFKFSHIKILELSSQILDLSSVVAELENVYFQLLAIQYSFSSAYTVQIRDCCLFYPISLTQPEFCSLIHLVKLDLSKNQLTCLPDDLGNLVNLQHLDLYNNKLMVLPVSFSQLRSLKWLDLKDNPLESGLAKAAGDCLDEKQCKQCASKVAATHSAETIKWQ